MWCGSHRNGGFGVWAACCGPSVFTFGRVGESRRAAEPKYEILERLREKPMTGYEVMEELVRARGRAAASERTVYPTLQMLEDLGYVVSEEVDGRRVYRITDEGEAFLERRAQETEESEDSEEGADAWEPLLAFGIACCRVEL